MPLKKGKSKKVQSENIAELVKSKPGKARAKAINTIAKKKGISKEKAKRDQAIAISFSIKRKVGKKK